MIAYQYLVKELVEPVTSAQVGAAVAVVVEFVAAEASNRLAPVVPEVDTVRLDGIRDLYQVARRWSIGSK